MDGDMVDHFSFSVYSFATELCANHGVVKWMVGSHMDYRLLTFLHNLFSFKSCPFCVYRSYLLPTIHICLYDSKDCMTSWLLLDSTGKNVLLGLYQPWMNGVLFSFFKNYLLPHYKEKLCRWWSKSWEASCNHIHVNTMRASQLIFAVAFIIFFFWPWVVPSHGHA